MFQKIYFDCGPRFECYEANHHREDGMTFHIVDGKTSETIACLTSHRDAEIFCKMMNDKDSVWQDKVNELYNPDNPFRTILPKGAEYGEVIIEPDYANAGSDDGYRVIVSDNVIRNPRHKPWYIGSQLEEVTAKVGLPPLVYRGMNLLAFEGSHVQLRYLYQKNSYDLSTVVNMETIELKNINRKISFDSVSRFATWASSYARRAK